MTRPADQPLTYGSAGVDYDALDAFKRACQAEASQTVDLLARHNVREAAGTRGESAYLIETPDGYLAHVEEGLGTKNLVADAVRQATGKCFYRNIGIDTVATIVNDLITVGCLPLSVAMHAAVGDSAWFNDKNRAAELAAGFAEGCRQSGAVWGGGETPALKGLIEPETIVLAGSAVGRMRADERVAGDVEPGDAIIFLASSGVQTNGLTLCRKIAERLPEGYLTPIGDGRAFGEALLEPSIIYAELLRAWGKANAKPRYLIHMTGHGWRKLMRLDRPFRYMIENPHRRGGPPRLFEFLIEAGPVERREAYATFNMGVGFAAIVRPQDAEKLTAEARAAGYDAWVAGRVEAGDKAVEMPSLGLTFTADELQVR